MVERKINNDLAKEIRNLAITKQLNVLIGSGCSLPAIPLMSYYEKFGEEKNLMLLQRIVSVSKLLTMYKIKSENKIWKTEIGAGCKKTEAAYINFIECIVDILEISNSRQVPKTVNIFTTNYDLFIENAINELNTYRRIVFNDGASGYFYRVLDSVNYNKVVAYKGLNDNYIAEIPSINLIKSHGSANWNIKDGKVIVSNTVVNQPMIVPPSGIEGQDTFMNDYFHDMLRIFQLELDKPQSILLVIGFSFQDKHIAKMFNRALKNPESIAFIFLHTDCEKSLLDNLGMKRIPSNLKIIKPSDIIFVNQSENEPNSDEKITTFTLNDLTKVLSIKTESEKCNE